MSAFVLLLCLVGDATPAVSVGDGERGAPTVTAEAAPVGDTSAPIGDPPPPLGDPLPEPDPDPPPPSTTTTPPATSSFLTPARPPPQAEHPLPSFLVPPWGALVGVVGGGVGAGVGAAYVLGDVFLGDLAAFNQPNFLTLAILLSTPAFAALVAGFFVVALVVPEPDIDHFGNVAACSAAGCVGTWLLLGLGLGGGAGCGTATCPSGSDCHGCGNVSASSAGGVDDSVGIAAAAAAGVGAMLGMGTGFLIGKALDDEVGNTSDANQRVGTAIGLVVGGALGGGVGGFFVGTETVISQRRATPRGGDHDEGLGELSLP